MVSVEQWAEIRRMYFVKRLSIKEIVRGTGHGRNTIRRAVRSAKPPRCRRPPRPSKLDPVRKEIHRSCARIRACRASGYGSYSRSRAMRAARRSSTTTWRGEAAVSAAAAPVPAHLVSAGRALPVRPLGAEPRDPGRSSQTRRGYIVVACLPYSGAGAATLMGHAARRRAAARRLDEELRRLLWIPSLTVDEVGHIPFDAQAANLMFSLVSSRCECASLIVTSNKPFSAWGEIFGDEVVAAAMIDRLVHHAEILSLKGDSYRLRDRDLGGRPPALAPDSGPSGDRGYAT